MQSDLQSDEKLEKVFPPLAEKWKKVRYDLYIQQGLQIKVTQGFRTSAEQLAIFMQGRTRNANTGEITITDPGSIVTHAQPSQSFHEYGLAIDSGFCGQDPFLEKHPHAELIWNAYGFLCQTHGLTWGGSFKDPDRPHCEISGIQLMTIKGIYIEGALPKVWNYCDQIRGIV